jgi:hypothetical protein
MEVSRKEKYERGDIAHSLGESAAEDAKASRKCGSTEAEEAFKVRVSYV